MPDSTLFALPSRFVEKIFPNPVTGCWLWTGFVQDNGYGKVAFNGRRSALVHRATYEMLVGPIPTGLVIDHLCRNRACCNPDHLRAVTQRVNTLAPGSLSPAAVNAAKTHCPYGHPLDTRRGNSRGCRTCTIAHDRARWPQRSKERSDRNAAERVLPIADRKRLLLDLIAMLDTTDRIRAVEAVERLTYIPRWNRHLADLTPRSRSHWLSAQLAPFGIKQRTHNFGGGHTNKGFKLADIIAAPDHVGPP